MLRLILFILQIISVIAVYKFPQEKLEAFEPKGFRFSFPDETGMNLVAFHANINKDLFGIEAGEISLDIHRPKNGFWIYENSNIQLKIGDTINFWIHVQINGLGYNNVGLSWTVTQYSNEPFPYPSNYRPTPNNPLNPKECEDATTTVNGKSVCPNKLIFDEHFNKGKVNEDVWRWQQRIADKPDYKFVSYVKNDFIGYIQDRWLVIKPQILPYDEIKSGNHLEFSECTSHQNLECKMTSKGWTILPPIKSARLSSDKSFNFKYGIIEIEAQLPRGDWITPEIWLTPKKSIYGPIEELYCGQIRIAFSRGNTNFEDHDGFDHGCRMLQAGIYLGRSGIITKKLLSRMKPDGCWSDKPYVFRVEWKPKSLEFRVDGDLVARIVPPNGGWHTLENWKELTEEDPWKKGTEMAPFDQEFFIELGVGVGGNEDFPDFPKSNKPWKNGESKTRLNFYQAKNKWEPTWSEKSSLKVKRVQVWAL